MLSHSCSSINRAALFRQGRVPELNPCNFAPPPRSRLTLGAGTLLPSLADLAGAEPATMLEAWEVGSTHWEQGVSTRRGVALGTGHTLAPPRVGPRGG